MVTVTAMNQDWRTRLLDAIDRDPRSDRRISHAAGLGVNAVNELRNTEKQPGIDRVLKIAREVGISQAHLFWGVEIDSEVEEIVAQLVKLPPKGREAFLNFLRAMPSTADAFEPPHD